MFNSNDRGGFRISLAMTCLACNSPSTVKNGHARRGYQQFLCRDCGKSFVVGGRYRRLSDRERVEMVILYHRGMGIREIARIYEVSPATVLYWIKRISPTLG